MSPIQSALLDESCSCEGFLDVLRQHAITIDHAPGTFGQVVLATDRKFSRLIMQKIACLGYCFPKRRDEWLRRELAEVAGVWDVTMTTSSTAWHLLARADILIRQCDDRDCVSSPLRDQKILLRANRLSAQLVERNLELKRLSDKRVSLEEDALVHAIMEPTMSLSDLVDNLTLTKLHIPSTGVLGETGWRSLLTTSVSMTAASRAKIRFLTLGCARSRSHTLESLALLCFTQLFNTQQSGVNLEVIRELIDSEMDVDVLHRCAGILRRAFKDPTAACPDVASIVEMVQQRCQTLSTSTPSTSHPSVRRSLRVRSCRWTDEQVQAFLAEEDQDALKGAKAKKAKVVHTDDEDDDNRSVDASDKTGEEEVTYTRTVEVTTMTQTSVVRETTRGVKRSRHSDSEDEADASEYSESDHDDGDEEYRPQTSDSEVSDASDNLTDEDGPPNKRRRQEPAAPAVSDSEATLHHFQTWLLTCVRVTGNPVDSAGAEEVRQNYKAFIANADGLLRPANVISSQQFPTVMKLIRGVAQKETKKGKHWIGLQLLN